MTTAVTMNQTSDGLSIPEYKWFAADKDNPMGVTVLDCRPLLTYVITRTSNPKVAEMFGKLRESDGSEHFGKLPEDPVEVDCDVRVSRPTEDGQVLFRAAEMEQKWDIFQDENHVYFVRSWTGKLCFVGRKAGNSIGLRIDKVIASKGLIGNQPDLAPKIVQFLLLSHVLEEPAPHPLPNSMKGSSDHQLAIHSFSLFGTAGQFASFEDTLRYRPKLLLPMFKTG